MYRIQVNSYSFTEDTWGGVIHTLSVLGFKKPIPIEGKWHAEHKKNKNLRIEIMEVNKIVKIDEEIDALDSRFSNRRKELLFERQAIQDMENQQLLGSRFLSLVGKRVYFQRSISTFSCIEYRGIIDHIELLEQEIRIDLKKVVIIQGDELHSIAKYSHYISRQFLDPDFEIPLRFNDKSFEANLKRVKDLI